MPTLHRWERERDCVEIEAGVSTDLNGGALVVNTNLPCDDLPVQFRSQVPASEESDLVSSVDRWAVPVGFEKTQ